MKRILGLLTLLIFTTTVHGAKEAKTALSFNSFIKKIEEQSYEILVEKINVKIAESAVAEAAGTTDPVVNGNTSIYQTESPQSVTAAKRDGVKAGAGVTVPFTFSGTRLYGEATMDSYNSESGSPLQESRSYEPSVTIGVRQPLLKNFLGVIDRSTLYNAQVKEKLAKLNYITNRAALLTDYKKLYVEWAAYALITSNDRKNINNALKKYQQIVRKRKARLAENDDEQQAYSALLGYRTVLYRNLILYDNRDKIIKEIIQSDALVPDSSGFNSLYQNAASHEIAKISFSESGSFKVLHYSLDLLRYQANVAGNSALPEFDLFGELTQKGSKESATDALASMDSTDYQIGFELTWTPGSREQEAKKEQLQLEYRALQLEIAQTKQKYRSELAATIASYTHLKKIILYSSRNIQALRSKLVTEQKKYQQSRVSLATLIDTSNKIASEQTALISAKLDLIKLYFDYLYLIS